MLLNGGELDGVRVMSRSTIKLMTSDHLGTRIAAPFQPVSFCWERPAIRSALALPCARAMGCRRAGLRGRVHVGWLRRHLFLGRSQGGDRRYLHDQAPSPIRAYYRKMFKSLVYQALVD
jgi:hypothetical protein